jgi:hypothetical protein
VGERTALKILHGFFHPLLRRILDVVHAPIKPQLEMLRREGFESVWVESLDRALRRWLSRFEKIPDEVIAKYPGRPLSEIAQETSILPELKQDFEKICDIIVVACELEKYHAPRWFSWLVEDLKAEGVIRGDEK